MAYKMKGWSGYTSPAKQKISKEEYEKRNTTGS